MKRGIRGIIENKPGAKARFPQPAQMWEEDQIENEMTEEERKKFRNYMRIQEQEDAAIEKWNKTNFCPTCNFVLTRIGLCPKCDKKFELKGKLPNKR